MSQRLPGILSAGLRLPVIAALDPAHLSSADPTAMCFGSNRADGPKLWRDIWGAGQGIGTISAVQPTAVVVDRLVGEYRATRDRLVSR